LLDLGPRPRPMIFLPFFIILFWGLDPRVYATDFKSVCKKITTAKLNDR